MKNSFTVTMNADVSFFSELIGFMGKVSNFAPKLTLLVISLNFGQNVLIQNVLWHGIYSTMGYLSNKSWFEVFVTQKHKEFSKFEAAFQFLWILKTGVPSPKKSQKFNQANDRLKTLGNYCQDMCLICPKIVLSSVHGLENCGCSKCPSLTFSREYMCVVWGNFGA